MPLYWALLFLVQRVTPTSFEQLYFERTWYNYTNQHRTLKNSTRTMHEWALGRAVKAATSLKELWNEQGSR